MDSATSARWPAVHPYLLLIFVALFWAGNVVLGRGVSGIIPPVTLNVLRWAIALAVLLPLAWPQLAGKGLVIRQHLPELVLLAIPSIAIYNTFIYLGTRTTTAANAGLIVGTMPIVILVLGSLAGEERLTTRRAAGIAISFAGVVFVIAKGTLSALYELRYVRTLRSQKLRMLLTHRKLCPRGADEQSSARGCFLVIQVVTRSFTVFGESRSVPGARSASLALGSAAAEL